MLAIVTYPSFLEANCVIVRNEFCFYHYRILQNSMAHNFNKKIFKDAELLYIDIANSFIKKNKEQLLGQLNYYICFVVMLGIERLLSRVCKESLRNRYYLLKETFC